jgi:hypothetical protein
MNENENTVAVEVEPNRFELIATFLDTTPEKVADLLTRVAAHSVYPLDYLTEMVASVVPATA